MPCPLHPLEPHRSVSWDVFLLLVSVAAAGNRRGRQGPYPPCPPCPEAPATTATGAAASAWSGTAAIGAPTFPCRDSSQVRPMLLDVCAVASFAPFRGADAGGGMKNGPPFFITGPLSSSRASAERTWRCVGRRCTRCTAAFAPPPFVRVCVGFCVCGVPVSVSVSVSVPVSVPVSLCLCVFVSGCVHALHVLSSICDHEDTERGDPSPHLSGGPIPGEGSGDRGNLLSAR